MHDILLSTAAPNWPWKRQTPMGSGRWGDFDFMLDELSTHADAWVIFESLEETRVVSCPANRLIFIAGEPGSISNYESEFLAQFSHVVISRQQVDHPQVWHRQQGHPWFVEKSFDDLVNMPVVKKTKGACVIVSDKAFTPGHAQRLQFVNKLKELLGDRLDVWGRGIFDFDSKWDLLKDYRYAVVLENTIEEDYISEKLPDAWLAFCLPFYAGCPNIEEYYSPGGYFQIDMGNVEVVARKLAQALDDESVYARALPEILKCRQKYLLSEQFFPNLASILKLVCAEQSRPRTRMTLRPNSYFLARRSALSINSFLAGARAKIGRALRLTR